MGAVLSGLLAFLQSLPMLIKLFEQIGKALADGAHSVQVNVELKKFDKAAEKAKETKDTSDLENLFKPKVGTSNTSH